MKRRLLLPVLARWLIAAGALLASSFAAPAGPAISREYQIKAVFLFNFAQFVEWPPAALAEPGAPLVVGVLGEDPFGSYLDDTVRGETVAGRPLLVRRYRRVEDVTACHILFIAASESGRCDTILAALRHRPILTVSDLAGFAGRGGMIELFTDKSKVRLRIDLTPARAASLAISSKLLRPADVITSPPVP